MVAVSLKKKENNIEIESPIQVDYDKSYYDYQCELLLTELDEFVSDGYYDMKDSGDVRDMVRIFVKRAKQVYAYYDNRVLIDMFKGHYQLVS